MAVNDLTIHRPFQANLPITLRRLVELIHNGNTDRASIETQVGLSPRHYNYYLEAACKLGFLDLSDEPMPRVTSAGQSLVVTPLGSTQERDILASAISNAESLKPYREFFALAGDDISELSEQIKVHAGLSESTSVRRAQALRAWKRYLRTEAIRPSAEVTRSSAIRQKSVTGQRSAAVATKLPSRLTQVAIAKAIIEFISPKDAEAIIAVLLDKMDFSDIRRIGGPGDKGIDITAKFGLKEIAVQVKKHSDPIGPGHVREFIGALFGMEEVHYGFLVSMSGFTKAARDASINIKDCKFQMILVDASDYETMAAQFEAITKE